jgi:hypothetical protein
MYRYKNNIKSASQKENWRREAKMSDSSVFCQSVTAVSSSPYMHRERKKKKKKIQMPYVILFKKDKISYIIFLIVHDLYLILFYVEGVGRWSCTCAL